MYGPGQPYDAAAFHSYGHYYGCTFFDPMDGSTLYFLVCDACLTTAEAQGRTYELPAVKPRPQTSLAPAKPLDTGAQVEVAAPEGHAYTVTCDSCFYAFHCTEETSRMDQFRSHIRKTVCPSCTQIIPFAANSYDPAPARSFIAHLSEARAQELFELSQEIGVAQEKLIASVVNTWIDKAGEVL